MYTYLLHVSKFRPDTCIFHTPLLCTLFVHPSSPQVLTFSPCLATDSSILGELGAPFMAASLPLGTAWHHACGRLLHSRLGWCIHTCIRQTPPFTAPFVHHSWLQTFIFAPHDECAGTRRQCSSSSSASPLATKSLRIAYEE